MQNTHGAGSAFGFRWRHAVAVFLAALAVRGLYLIEAGKQPDFHLFNMDQQYNLDWAGCIASGNWPAPCDRLHNAAFFRAPLYSYSMAGVFLLFGRSPLLICVLQVLVGSLSCVLAWRRSAASIRWITDQGTP